MPRTPPWLQSLLEEHFEELQLLWELRCDALRDADYDAADLAELDDRIEAHTDALVLSLGPARPMLIDALGESEAATVFAAAYPLLCSGDPAARQAVVTALTTAVDDARWGFRDALCHGPITSLVGDLEAIEQTQPAEIAIVAAEALAVQRVGASTNRLAEYVQHADPAVRQAAWRLVAATQDV